MQEANLIAMFQSALTNYSKLSPEEKGLIPVSFQAPFDGLSAYIRPQTAGDRDAFAQRVYEHQKAKSGKPIELRAFYVCRQTVDADGVRIFSDQQESMLSALPAEAIEEAFIVASTKASIQADDKPEIEESIEKNQLGG